MILNVNRTNKKCEVLGTNILRISIKSDQFVIMPESLKSKIEK